MNKPNFDPVLDDLKKRYYRCCGVSSNKSKSLDNLHELLFALLSHTFPVAGLDEVLMDVLRHLDTGLINTPSIKPEHIQIAKTPLMLAVYAGHGHLVEILLKHGADPKLVDASKRTALHHAFWNAPNPHVVALLLRYGADVDAKDKSGITPLALGMMQGGFDKRMCGHSFEILIEHGASMQEFVWHCVEHDGTRQHPGKITVAQSILQSPPHEAQGYSEQMRAYAMASHTQDILAHCVKDELERAPLTKKRLV